jgi:general secretion pathway protein D
VPLSEPDDVFITREFPVRATFFEIETDETATDTSRTTRRRTRVQPTSGESKDTIRQALVARGVQFLDGATAIYNQATGILTVRNTQDQIDLIEELVTDDQGESLMVKVEAKFVEINQTDLDELTPQFNLQGSYTPVPGTRNFNVSAASVSIGNGLNGSTNVKTADGINQFLNIDPSVGNAAAPQSITVNPNQVGITGALDGNRFATLINLISQKTSSDVMTAPSIIVNDGAQASINVSREFSYPTEYDPPDIQSSIGFSSLLVGFAGAGAGGITSTSTDVETSRITVVPSFPTDFEERNVGVTMTVKPQVTVDRQRVYLTMQPELVEFDGFINYGSPVLDPIGDGSSTNVVATNEVRQPVFSTRTVKNAQLEIKDGYTMVLGGLIREDISTVEEKVPFLGDLPFVGRAFRSNAEQSVKRNLLIFVTVRILRPDGEPYNANAGVNAIATASAP